MSFKELITQDQRLVVLRVLSEAGYDANESIINDGLIYTVTILAAI